MNNGANKEERAEQREILQRLYPDYKAVHHDVFVSRYNQEREREWLTAYEINRGIK